MLFENLNLSKPIYFKNLYTNINKLYNQLKLNIFINHTAKEEGKK
jgi:hypothetical protein